MKTLLILFSIIILEFLLESYCAQKYYHTKNIFYRLFKVHHFSIGRYVVYYGIPFVTIFAWISTHYHPSYVIAFLVFGTVGTILEWFLGYAYHKVVGTRLWTYHQYSISGYTSLLSIPLWSLGGFFFWSLSNLIG